MKRNQYRKPEPKNGRKSSRKKSQSGEEGRRIFSESVEENPREEDPVLNRPVCIHSTSPLASSARPTPKNMRAPGTSRCIPNAKPDAPQLEKISGGFFREHHFAALHYG